MERHAATVRVLLVEDNEVYRSSLELLLGLQDGIEVVASVPDGAAAIRACVETGADVVLMDFRLPGLNGAEATTAVRSASPTAAVVGLTAEATEADRKAMMAAGAIALVEKGRPIEELVTAIRRAARWS